METDGDLANYLYVLRSRQDYLCTEERRAWRYRLILMPDAHGTSPPKNFATPPARKGRSKGGAVASGRETSGADGTGEGGHGGGRPYAWTMDGSWRLITELLAAATLFLRFCFDT